MDSNRREAHKLESFGESLGLPSMAPPIVYFPIKDEDGMQIAIGIRNRLLDPGLHEEYVQHVPLFTRPDWRSSMWPRLVWVD
eukprot:scaffold208_cov63-Attheya_sp.AAC.3